MPAPSVPSPRCTEQLVRGLICHRKAISPGRLHLSTCLTQDLGFDVVDVILAVEQCFHLTIPDEVPLGTVRDLVGWVNAHLPPRLAA